MPSSSFRALFKTARRFRRDKRGASAVEFSLIATAFFALLFAIIETGLVFFAGQVLETVAQDSARMIMTGQAQGSAMTQAQFKNNVVCPKVVALFDCANGIYIDVQSYPSFSTVQISDPIDTNKTFINNMQYNPGASGDIVIVRLFYQWPLIVTGLGYDMSNLAGSKRLLSATTAFKNEPF